MKGYQEDRERVFSDTECYPGYWSIGFENEEGRRKVYELYDGCELDRQAIARAFRKRCVVTFNGIKYDIPMILYAMSGADNAELKRASDELIQLGVDWWTFLDRRGLKIPDFFDHIDLMQVSPGAPTMPSLKIYSGRLHCQKMQELPIEVDEFIDAPKRQVIRAYHGNDLSVTKAFHKELKAQIELRTIMSREYGVDLRSKSDAQVAEAAIKAEIEKAVGHKVYAPEIEPKFFNYQVPQFVKFQTPVMQEALEFIRTAKLKVNSAGLVDAPERLQKLILRIGEGNYQMGIGGLHSQESNVSHFSDSQHILLDRDVTSYYPQTILLQGMYPEHLGPVFLKVYRRIFERRVAAKKGGQKSIAETLKIVLNGTFGKLGNVYSIFYSPTLMIQVTLTGQLAILMLIEMLELNGIQVVSANTDGIVSRVPRDKRWLFEAIFFDWECLTGYTTEESIYRSLHSQSVNAYVALKVDEKDKLLEVKRKGVFGKDGPGLDGAMGMKKNPNKGICSDAIVAYLKDYTPFEQTIRACRDIRKFVVVNRVQGGAERDGEYLGKALRWYYAKGITTPFTRRSNGNKVSMTVGAKLLMDLPESFPTDVDHGYYIRECYAMLQDLGMPTGDPRMKDRTGSILARLPEQKSIHVIDPKSGIAICGKARKSIRESWVEFPEIPDGHRMCGKCAKKADI